MLALVNDPRSAEDCEHCNKIAVKYYCGSFIPIVKSSEKSDRAKKIPGKKQYFFF